ncbi:34051_t:CDS:2, partial [Racocetra persica]
KQTCMPKNEMMKNWVTLKERIPNIENDRLIQAKLSTLQVKPHIIIHTSIGLSIADAKIDGLFSWKIKRIIEEIQHAYTMEAKNSAANKCHRVQIEDLLKIKRSINKTLLTKVVRYKSPNQPLKEHKIECVKLCFDTQHYFAAGSGRYPDDYKQVIDKYRNKIYLLHINNVMKERKIKQKDRFVKKIKATIFGSRQDIHALLLQGQLSHEIFKKIAIHPKIKAMILETPGRTEKQKQEQICEVYRCDKNKYEAPEIISLADQVQRLHLKEQERYQDPQKQEAIERMRRKQIEQ